MALEGWKSVAGVVVARAVEVAEGALEILDFALVVNFLPFGEFECFEHFFHFIEGVFEFVDDAIYLVDGIGDGGGAVRALGRFFVLAGFPGTRAAFLAMMAGFVVAMAGFLLVLLGFFGGWLGGPGGGR
jgi:hypothetical protein